MACTLVPDDATYDDEGCGGHQHEAVVDITMLVAPCGDHLVAEEATATEELTDEGYDNEDLGIAETVTDTIEEGFPRTVHHGERFEASHQDTVCNNQADVN